MTPPDSSLCPAGHPKTPENTLVWNYCDGTSRRRCRECERARRKSAAYRKTHREAVHRREKRDPYLRLRAIRRITALREKHSADSPILPGQLGSLKFGLGTEEQIQSAIRAQALEEAERKATRERERQSEEARSFAGSLRGHAKANARQGPTCSPMSPWRQVPDGPDPELAWTNPNASLRAIAAARGLKGKLWGL